MATIDQNLRKKTTTPFLPDEIISNILIKLPAKYVMRCRLVCKRFRDLTITPQFVELHSKITINFPTILVASLEVYSPPSLSLTALDRWWEPTIERSRFDCCLGNDNVNGKVRVRVLLSHCGLIVLLEEVGEFYSRRRFIILNPIRPKDEWVTISLARGLPLGSMIYGVCYHPSLKQYCALLAIGRSEYGVLNLGFKPSFKKVRNPFIYRRMKQDSHPLSINNCIYWLLECKRGFHRPRGHNDTLVFDIIKEEFTVIPCPVPVDTRCLVIQTHLLAIDGVLSYIVIVQSGVRTWRLEDCAGKKLWMFTSYTRFSQEIVDTYVTIAGMHGVAGVDGKLALPKNNKFLVCDLVEGTILNNNTMKMPYVLYISHQMSLASLNNCMSEIHISKDWKVWARG